MTPDTLCRDARTNVLQMRRRCCSRAREHGGLLPPSRSGPRMAQPPDRTGVSGRPRSPAACRTSCDGTQATHEVRVPDRTHRAEQEDGNAAHQRVSSVACAGFAWACRSSETHGHRAKECHSPRPLSPIEVAHAGRLRRPTSLVTAPIGRSGRCRCSQPITQPHAPAGGSCPVRARMPSVTRS